VVRVTHISPDPDFSNWDGPGDPSGTATGPEMFVEARATFGDVVAIDSARHGLERGFFHSKISAGIEDSFFVQ